MTAAYRETKTSFQCNRTYQAPVNILLCFVDAVLELLLQVDPLAPKPQAQALLEIYKSLQAAEKEVLQHIRDSEWEGREIGRMRNNQEQSIALETPYYDICRVQVGWRALPDTGQGRAAELRLYLCCCLLLHPSDACWST